MNDPKKQAWYYGHRREIDNLRTDLRKQLKLNFKHIQGMVEAANHEAFGIENKLDTKAADRLIDKKLIAPSNRVIECQRGV
jgi:hypothetical protein